MADKSVGSCIGLFSALIGPCSRRTIYRWIQGEIANAVMSGMALSLLALFRTLLLVRSDCIHDPPIFDSVFGIYRCSVRALYCIDP